MRQVPAGQAELKGTRAYQRNIRGSGQRRQHVYKGESYLTLDILVVKMGCGRSRGGWVAPGQLDRVARLGDGHLYGQYVPS